ncbi:hypothetical protein J2S49_000726 [Arcanobacterium wilhelmae]|uniref:DUF2516 family protein n=1 Tax=Arcanobacterium wilhelmae TaxID=1803177 RepID=A0ABT9NAB9_9ACTO|nr:hypothetical protein [Arcanobacterium wilhelmae]MDP9800650.1 hypothetical protein [Arcanobacterium wilhelmae]WFN90053.1 hypothetical protein P8A24_07615 [Arcanobacterium wilhelmae]
MTYWMSWLLANLVPALLFAGAAFSLVDALLRPADRWWAAAQPKKFWLIWMVVSLALVVADYLYRLPLGGILTLVIAVGIVYYIGPERQRMGRWR